MRHGDVHLRLNPEEHEFKLVFGAIPANDREVAVRTRLLVQIMSMISAEIEVLPEHVKEGRTIPGPQYDHKPLIQIHCTADKPKDAMGHASCLVLITVETVCGPSAAMPDLDQLGR